MEQRLKYDIALPNQVEEILDAEFWIFDPLTAPMIHQSFEPMKFESMTSIFVRRGSCLADINLIETRIEAPCVVNIKANNYLHPREVSDDFEACFVVMSKRLTENLFMFTHTAMRYPMARVAPVMPLSPEIARRYEQLYADLKKIREERANPNQFEAVLFTMLSFFFTVGYRAMGTTDNEGRSAAARLTDKFMALVREHFRSHRFLQFYADSLEVTSKHLSRTLKTQTGYSAVEWIERYVMLEAKVMLKSSNLNIQQIATELSFPSQSTFGKFFKKNTGLSPMEFRNS